MFRNLSSLKDFKPRSLLDIGAHHGSFTISFKKNITSAKSFFLIEANKNCEKVLKLLPFEYEICLLSNLEEEKKFYVNPKNNMCCGNSYYIENTKNFDKNKFRIIKSNTLDKLMENKKTSFDVIKLDTQGSELLVLEGAPNLLNKIKYIKTEVADFDAYQNGCQFKDIDIFLADYGFKRIRQHKFRSKDNIGSSYDILYKKTM